MSAPDARGRHRVAITGLGVKSPAGSKVGTLFDTMLAGRSVAARITNFDPARLPVTFACEVDEFSPTDYMGVKEARRMDRVSQLGYAAALDAVADASLPSDLDHDRCGVVFGTGTGGIQTLSEQAIVCDERGPKLVSPMMVPMFMANATNALVSIELGWTGPSIALATACASSTNAVGEAARYIREGYCDVVATGGAENSVHVLALAGFCRSGALSKRNHAPEEASRPFDADRDGYVMGEGAACLVLERHDLAVARGAHIYGEVLGYGFSCDAFHITRPRDGGAGAATCIRHALTDAGVDGADITSVNAHGTSTLLNDAMESTALRTVFGAGTVPPVTSSKGVFGHMMGAAGAIEAVVATLSAEAGVVPPTANHENTDPECGIDVVAGEPRSVPRGPVLSNSFGFGGHNASLVIGPADREPVAS